MQLTDASRQSELSYLELTEMLKIDKKIVYKR
jgi:hypothetical protein